MEPKKEGFETNVFAAMGIPPEIQAYALAKYSRSAAGFRESVRELSGVKAADFLNTFYFQYGHPSIADLAHIVVAIENTTLVEAVRLWTGEGLKDGQESSTRYQDFSRRRYGVPVELQGTTLEPSYREFLDRLFDSYSSMRGELTGYLTDKHAATRPRGEYAPDDKALKRTLDARVFDRLRYVLPAATLTNLGLIMSARTAEKLIVRLASDSSPSIQRLADQIREALRDKPVYNLLAERAERHMQDLAEFEGRDKWIEIMRDIVLADIQAAPTLAKYTKPSEYQQWTYQAIKDASRQYLSQMEPRRGRNVELYTGLPPEIEVPATLLFRGSNYAFGQVVEVVAEMSPGERRDLIALSYEKRDKYDSPIIETAVGRNFIFSVQIDNGALRDLIRHRNNILVVQDLTPELGFDTPEDIRSCGINTQYQELMQQATVLARAIKEQYPEAGQYVLPLAYRRNVLFKMDSWQAAYIAELRTKYGGHFSYRQIVYWMFHLMQKQVPILAQYMRVTDPLDEGFWNR